MAYVACFFLILLLVGIQHLLNWVWRNFGADEAPFAVLVAFFGIVLSLPLLYHLILWACPLIQ